MNLVIDPWVPVRLNGDYRHATFRDILCRDEPWELSLPRDDMELAALQLLVCLTQVMFLPKDADELRAAEAQPMREDRFDLGIRPYAESFDLAHAKQPFMQTAFCQAKEPTPIQKLFVGLPEGNNHALFNDVGEVQRACPSCVAIALFNEATACPSMGGGFKAPLRGASPVTTLVRQTALRRMVWRNVLDAPGLAQLGISHNADDLPIWVVPVARGEQIPASKIGLCRGLFWQPMHAVLRTPSADTGLCDACGLESKQLYADFDKEKFTFDVLGLWPHPHSPRRWGKEPGDVHFSSFRANAPAWTQLAEFVVARQEGDQGCAPAAVVTSHRQRWPGELSLLVGGYRNDQASIVERRHEMFSLRLGWEENLPQLEATVGVALRVRDALRSKAYGFAKQAGVPGVAREAERSFYLRTEHGIRRLLRQIDFGRVREELTGWAKELGLIARAILDEVTAPYSMKPKGMKFRAKARRSMNAALAKITTDLESE